MATRTTGTIIFKATHGHTAKMVIDGCKDMDSLKAFVTIVKKYVDATVTSMSFATTETVIEPGGLATGNTDRKAIIKYNDDLRARVKTFSVPGLKSGEAISVLEKEGERLMPLVVKDLTEALGTCTGGEVTGLSGDVIQSH